MHLAHKNLVFCSSKHFYFIYSNSFFDVEIRSIAIVSAYGFLLVLGLNQIFFIIILFTLEWTSKYENSWLGRMFFFLRGIFSFVGCPVSTNFCYC